MSFLSENELIDLNFKSLGKNVKISKLAVFFNPQNISIGDNSRIDAFCLLSASNEIIIGKYVHISAYVSMVGEGKIIISDFSAVSFKCSLFSSTDDYSGEYMSNPTVPNEFKNVENGDIIIGRHVIVGANCVVLPNINIIDGVSVGALSLIKNNINKIGIYGGIPCKYIKEKSTNMFELEKKLIK